MEDDFDYYGANPQEECVARLLNKPREENKLPVSEIRELLGDLMDLAWEDGLNRVNFSEETIKLMEELLRKIDERG